METLQGRNEESQAAGQPAPQAATTGRMKCPTCKKVYNVEIADLLDAQRTKSAARFECVACKSRFSAVAPSNVASAKGSVMVETYFSAIAPETRSDLKTKAPARKVSRLDQVSPRKAALNQPMFSCPKCRTVNSRAADECRSCGIIFSKYRSELDKDKILSDGDIPGSPELVAMWKDLIDDYESMVLHERFLEACRASDNLGFASQQYGKILSIAPDEEIARKMRMRIVALSTMSFIRESKPVKNFRVPGFSGMAILLGSIVTTMGLLLGNMHNLTGIGGSMLALAIGIRFYLRPIR